MSGWLERLQISRNPNSSGRIRIADSSICKHARGVPKSNSGRSAKDGADLMRKLTVGGDLPIRSVVVSLSADYLCVATVTR